MFTASIIGKEIQVDGRTKVEVSFTDGVKTFSKFVIPQDKDGLEGFILGELKQLNIADADIPIGVFTPPTPTPPVVDTETQARIDWFTKVGKLSRVRTLLLDTKVLLGDEAEITNLVNEVKQDYKKEYLDFI